MTDTSLDSFSCGAVWFCSFPFEDTDEVRRRPVIVLNVYEETLEILSVKVTSQDVREYDEFDMPIIHWREAGLDRPSTARISKSILLPKDVFVHFLGNLVPEDLDKVIEHYSAYVMTLVSPAE